MSDELDPPGRELESLYESLRSDALGDAELRRIEANLGPLLDPAGGSSGGGAGSGFSARLFLLPGAVLGVATLAMLSLVVSESRPRAQDDVLDTAPVVHVQSEPALERPVVEPRTAEPALEAAEPSAVEPAAPPREPAEPAFDEGAELLQRARTALASDPETALALAERHERRFPRGLLTLERELVAIDALVVLGRREAAEARGRRLLEADPDNGRVRRKLAQHGLALDGPPN
jgi:hypothetical protein